MQCIYQGAEAKLYQQGDELIKQRVPKGYRLPEVDHALRVQRHRREVKVLKELHSLGISAPSYISDDEATCIIRMRFLKGEMLKTILCLQNQDFYASQMGELLALLHNADIIHGDLTTSNLIVGDKLYFIDFGLSFFSKRVEDKAVDIHLLGCAIESKHPSLYPLFYDNVLKAYSKRIKGFDAIVTRLHSVQGRGRNKLGS